MPTTFGSSFKSQEPVPISIKAEKVFVSIKVQINWTPLRSCKPTCPRICKSVFFSTHLLDQAEKLCHRVGILEGGKLVACGPLDELKAQLAPGGSLEEIFFAVTEDRDA